MAQVEDSLVDDLCLTPAVELLRLMHARELSPVELVDGYLGRISREGSAVNAFVTVLAAEARALARDAERKIVEGRIDGALLGLPIAVKDAGAEKRGVRHTNGSLVFKDNVSSADSLQVERIERAGGIVLGKTNTPELGHRGTTDNKLVGPTSTPFAPGWNAGGSSGGSAAAVAGGFAAVAQGSDGGGSVRIPAALCGCVGLIATWGRVPVRSRPNAFAARTPFIHLGTFGRTVGDAALLLRSLAGPDPGDPSCLPDDGCTFDVPTSPKLDGIRVGYVPTLDYFQVEDEVAQVVEAAVRKLVSVGAVVDLAELGLPGSPDELVAIWRDWTGVQQALAFDELATEGHDLFGRDRKLLSPHVAAMAERGASLNAVQIEAYSLVRTRVVDAFSRFFRRYDVLVSPTVGVASIRNRSDGETIGPAAVNGVPVDTLLGWCLTFPTNFVGLPAASVPAGFTSTGFPVGLQIVGPRFGDDQVLLVARGLEVASPWDTSYARVRSIA